MRELPRLGYGAANVGNLYRELDDEQAWAILDAAWQSGIRFFDTAPHYGLGLSERRLGAFLATKPRDQFIVSTKAGRSLIEVTNSAGITDIDNGFAVPADSVRHWDPSSDGIRKGLDESLDRLGLDRVDILFLHDPEKYDLESADREGYPALIALREEGAVDRVGVGSMAVETIVRAASNAGLDLLMVAGRLTIAEQPALGDYLPHVSRNKIELIAAGVFSSGLLASNSPGEGARYEYGKVPTPMLDRVNRIAAVCRDFDVDLPTAALQFPLRIVGVHSIVVGGSRPQQVVENAGHMQEHIPEEFWLALQERELIP